MKRNCIFKKCSFWRKPFSIKVFKKSFIYKRAFWKNSFEKFCMHQKKKKKFRKKTNRQRRSHQKSGSETPSTIWINGFVIENFIYYLKNNIYCKKFARLPLGTKDIFGTAMPHAFKKETFFPKEVPFSRKKNMLMKSTR